jgi:hypothetical protein
MVTPNEYEPTFGRPKPATKDVVEGVEIVTPVRSGDDDARHLFVERIE